MLSAIMLLAVQAGADAGPMRLGDARMGCPALIAEAGRTNGEARGLEAAEIHAIVAKQHAQMNASAAVQGVAGLVPFGGTVAGAAAHAALRAEMAAEITGPLPLAESQALRGRADLLLDLARIKGCAVPYDADDD